MINLDMLLDVSNFLCVKEEVVLSEYCRLKSHRVNTYLTQHHEIAASKDIPKSELYKLAGMALQDTFDHYSIIILSGR